jgi:hypothetical protein
MLGVAVLAVATCVAPISDTLVGFWESARTSRGGIGHTLELRRDGVAVASTSVIVNLFYRTSKGELFVGENPEATAHSNGSRYTVQDDVLLVTEADGKAVTRERLGAREGTLPPSIVGRWHYRHYTGPTAYEWYTQDGRLLFRLPMTSNVGCYSVSGNQLTMTAPRAATTPFETRKNQLLLIREGSEAFAYDRVTAGPWYPRNLEAIGRLPK